VIGFQLAQSGRQKNVYGTGQLGPRLSILSRRLRSARGFVTPLNKVQATGIFSNLFQSSKIISILFGYVKNFSYLCKRKRMEVSIGPKGTVDLSNSE